MSNQPEALRLADQLGRHYTHLTVVPEINRQAAAELRRLHAENALLHERHHFDNGVLKELRSTAELALEALEMAQDHWTTYHGLRSKTIGDAADALRLVIDKAT